MVTFSVTVKLKASFSITNHSRGFITALFQKSSSEMATNADVIYVLNETADRLIM